jgi:hypothetical protein
MEKTTLRGAKLSVFLTQYCSGYLIEKNELRGTFSAYGGGGDVCRVLMGKLERKRPLGRLRRRWEDNITMDLQEVVRAWIQDRDS